MTNDSLGDRMKRHERASEHYLMRRTPVIIRIDGKAFHTLTASLSDRFDPRMHHCMMATMGAVCSSIQGAVFGYTQSDEISILVRDWDTVKTEAWFDYRQNKVESVAASIATMAFNSYAATIPEFQIKPAMFDARAFNLPKEEVVNYFIWRQQDAERNSIQTYGRTVFSHKQLHGKSNPEVITMLDQAGKSWQLLDTWKKRGTAWVGGHIGRGKAGRYSAIDMILGYDEDIPIFKNDRDYIEYAMNYVRPAGEE
jgi:tRNA(His) 5'-end guanylyltransferase